MDELALKVFLETLAHLTKMNHANIPHFLAARAFAVHDVQADWIVKVFYEAQGKALEQFEEAFIHEGIVLPKLRATISIHCVPKVLAQSSSRLRVTKQPV